MIGLALQSLRSRAAGFTACFVSIFLGTAMIAAFVSLSETGFGDVSAADEETLTTMGMVVGSWAVIIVLFSVVSTMAITVRQRATEVGVLRTLGTTPRQLRSMVVSETVVTATAAALLALVPGVLLGRWTLSLVRDAEMVSSGVSHAPGAMTLVSTPVVMVMTAAVAAMLAVRRATKVSAREAQVAAATGAARMGKLRIAAAILLLALAVNYAVLTMTVMDDSSDPYGAMSTAGPACVFGSAGFALLAPVLLRVAATALSGPLRLARSAGYLAAFNTRRRAHLVSGVLMPVVLFTGMSTGTLYLMAIQSAATEGVVKDAEAKNIEFLNYVVVGMIAVFAAIMIINTMVSAILQRRREFGEQRLNGATPGQVQRMVGLEGIVITVVGVVLGTIASTATIIPYSVVKLDQPLPDTGVWLLAGVIGVAALVTLGTGLATTRRGLRLSPVEAAALPT